MTEENKQNLASCLASPPFNILSDGSVEVRYANLNPDISPNLAFSGISTMTRDELTDLIDRRISRAIAIHEGKARRR